MRNSTLLPLSLTLLLCPVLGRVALTPASAQPPATQPPATQPATAAKTVLPPQNVVEECAERLATQLSEMLTRKSVVGTLTKADDRSVTLNIGANDGVLPGLMFTVIATADGKETPVGMVKVTRVGPTESVCEVVKTETGQAFATNQKAVRQIRTLSVGVAGEYGPVAQHPCAPGLYLTDDLSDRLVGRSPFSKIVSRKTMATWVNPRSESENQDSADLGMDDFAKPDTVKKVATASGTDALLYCHLERDETGTAIRVTARLVDGSDGSVIAVARENLATSDAVNRLLPGALLYELKMIEQDSNRPVLAGGWTTRTFSEQTMLVPSGPNTNVTLINRDFVTDYTVNLVHDGAHQAAWQETLVLQWKDGGNWVGVRFSGNQAFIVGMTEGATWTGTGEPIDVTDKGGRGHLELEAKVIGRRVLIQANGKTQMHVLKQTFPAYVGLACITNTDDQGTIPSVWRISKLKVVRAIR